MTKRRVTPMAVICGSLVVLGSPPCTAQRVRAYDSAGVHVVDNPPIGSSRRAFELGHAPFLDLGGLRSNPDEEFNARNWALSAMRMSDGGVVVEDEYQLKLFDSHGQLVRVIGRHGAGPGEFDSIEQVCKVTDDSILAVSASDNRITVFDRRGVFIRTVPIPVGSAVSPEGCFEDGTLIVRQGQPIDVRSLTPTAIYLRARYTGRVLNRLGRLPYGAIVGIQRDVSLVAHGGAVYVGEARAYGFQVLSASSGRLTMIVHARDQLVPFTSADRDLRARYSIPNHSSPANTKAITDRLKSEPTPGAWPTYSELKVDAAGRVWLHMVRAHFAEGAERWAAFDPEGRLLGQLVLPPQATAEGWRIIAVGRDYLLVRRRDEDGAAHLSFFALTPTS